MLAYHILSRHLVRYLLFSLNQQQWNEFTEAIEVGHRESKSWCRSRHFDPTDAKAAGRWLFVFGLVSQQQWPEFQWHPDFNVFMVVWKPKKSILSCWWSTLIQPDPSIGKDPVGLGWQKPRGKNYKSRKRIWRAAISLAKFLVFETNFYVNQQKCKSGDPCKLD